MNYIDNIFFWYILNSNRYSLEEGSDLLATPAHRQSKSRKLKRRATQKLTLSAIHWDNQLQDYVLSHHVSLKGYCHGRQVVHKLAK